MKSPRFALPFAFILGLAACGGASSEPATPPAANPPADGAPSAAPAAAAPAGGESTKVAWKAMTDDQKLQHMKTVIAPTMGKVFKDADATRYANFGCGTCHGEKKEDPHKALPKLTLSGDGFQKLSAAKPAVVKFMAEKVTPAMAAAMGEKPFDPATKQGFGCGGCHTVN